MTWLPWFPYQSKVTNQFGHQVYIFLSSYKPLLYSKFILNTIFVAENLSVPDFKCLSQFLQSQTLIFSDFSSPALRGNLSSHLYGQHLVEDTLFRSLNGHVTYGSDKPLVFSFHGSCGTGKSFVSKLIAKSWFKRGIYSNFFNLMIGTKDFPFKSNSSMYKVSFGRIIVNKMSIVLWIFFFFFSWFCWMSGCTSSNRTYLH